jgi:hypothetical protein
VGLTGFASAALSGIILGLNGIESQNVGVKQQDKTHPACQQAFAIGARIHTRTLWHRSQTTTSRHRKLIPALTRGAGKIRRYSKPMGVTIGEGGFRSQSAAEFAGKRALQGFLEQLAVEEQRDPRSSK